MTVAIKSKVRLMIDVIVFSKDKAVFVPVKIGDLFDFQAIFLPVRAKDEIQNEIIAAALLFRAELVFLIIVSDDNFGFFRREVNAKRMLP